MTTEKPAHIVRFEKLRERGRWLYITTTAGSVALVIGAIQWFNGHFSWESVSLYAFAGAAIALVDWMVLSKRYRDYHDSADTKR